MKRFTSLVVCVLLVFTFISCGGDVPEPEIYNVELTVRDGDVRNFQVTEGTNWDFPEIAAEDDGHYPVVAIDEEGEIIPIEEPVRIDKDRKFEVKWTDWKYKIDNGSLILAESEVRGNDKDIYIPYMIDGQKVTTLGYLYNNAEITDIHIPNWVHTINYTFNRTKIAQITIPSTIRKVVQLSFKTIDKPEPLPYTLIFEDASIILDWDYTWSNGFAGKIIAKGDGIREKDGIFYIDKIDSEGNPTLGVLLLANWQDPIETITIPATVDEIPVISIEKGAFANAENFGKIILPEGLKLIGDHAFSYTKITDITLPSSLEYIGSYAFSGIETLTTITIPSNCKPENWSEDWKTSFNGTVNQI